MDKLWRFENVTKAGLQKPRLINLTLEIHSGITAVMGYSGAGKTSFLNLLADFEKPDQGRVAFCPPPSKGMPYYWVPQNEGLWPHLTAEQHLETMQSDSDPATVNRLLNDFDMADLKSALPDEMSLGERARLAVARALAGKPPIIIMDEPLVHVDLMRRRKYWQLIKDYLDENNASLVYASHQPNEVLGLAERVLFLKAGHILFHGSVETLYHQPADEETAWCLGEINWFDEAEAQLWLHQGSHDPQGYRPERICISHKPNSKIVIETFAFHGSIAEVTLRHTETGKTRLFYYRPSIHKPTPGIEVQVDVLSDEIPGENETLSNSTKKRGRD